MRSSVARLSLFGLAIVAAAAAPACGLDGGGVGSSNGASGGGPERGGADASSDGSGGTGDDATSSGDDGPVSNETGATGDDGSSPNDAAGGDGGTCTPPCAAQQTCGAGGLCVAARRVFVSSTQSNGNLGGPSGADGKCQALAGAASLGGTWKSWTSDTTTSPSARFTQSTDPYVLLDGRVVALNWTSLTTLALVNAIDLDEKKKAVATGVEVWTGTRQGGTSLTGCNGFTTAGHGDDQPFVGRVGNTDKGWSEFAADARCDQNNLRIYCFEQ